MLYIDKMSVVAVDISAYLQRHNSSSLGDSEWVARFYVWYCFPIAPCTNLYKIIVAGLA